VTPAYGLKHWWRAAREPGESLKQFARKHAGYFSRRLGTLTTSGTWLARKSNTAIQAVLAQLSKPWSER